MRTKAQEIEMLEKWYNEAQEKPGSPLAKFMSADMFDCVSSRLHDGMDTDLLSLWHKDRDTLLSRPSPAEVEALQDELRAAIDERDMLKTVCDRSDSKVSFEMSNNARLERELAGARLERELAGARLNWQIEREQWTRERQILNDAFVQHEAEINRLKAKLYDIHEAQEQSDD